jgi:Kdo2-lipid IVA lauroyltransferase/acyltransferase
MMNPVETPETDYSPPAAAWSSWGGLLGDAIFLADRPHRIIVRRNLAFAFPQWTRREVAACTRRVFRHIGQTMAEILAAPRMSRRGRLHHAAAAGEHHLDRTLAEGTGVILVSAHLGNWEVGLQDLGRRIARPIGIVVRPVTPGVLDRWVNRRRTRSGNRIIYKKNAFPEMLKTVRGGGVVALMVDMSVRKQSVPVEFFGHRARASHAAALLAARSKAAILPMFSYRGSDGRLTGEIGAPVAVSRSRNLKSDIQKNTQVLTDIVEAAIRKRPDQYFWVQKRWKDYHPELYPGYRPRPFAFNE